MRAQKRPYGKRARKRARLTGSVLKRSRRFRRLHRTRRAVADRNLARTLGFGYFAHQIDMQQAILQTGARHLDVVGELEAALESARGNALIEHFRALAFLAGLFRALD